MKNDRWTIYASPFFRCACLAGSLLATQLLAPHADAGSLTVTHAFTGGPDGAMPMSGITLDSQGNVYGETYDGAQTCAALGGTYGCGTVYKVDATGHFTTLVTFNGTNGAASYGVLSLVHQQLFGSAGYSAPVPFGLVFSVNTDGTGFKILHQFNGMDGFGPGGTLPVMPDGTIFGTTLEGGPGYSPATQGYGVLFELKPDGTYLQLHGFTGFPDGHNPGSIVVAPDGTIYGATAGISQKGGGTGKAGGTIYSYVPSAGVFKTLYMFRPAVGNNPQLGGITPAGDLVGTTGYGGTFGDGTLFTFGKRGLRTLWNFTGGTDGYEPGPPTVGADGLITGTTAKGGIYPFGGTIYRYSNNTLTTLFAFPTTLATSQYQPLGNLAVDLSGVIHGATAYTGYGFAGAQVPCDLANGHPIGGFGCGGVFSFAP